MRDSWDSCEPEVGSNGQKFERWMAKLLYLYHIFSFDRLVSLLKVEALSLNSGFNSHAITVPGGFWSLWLKFLSTDVAQDKSWVPGNPLGVLEGGGYRICCFPALLTYIFSPFPLLPDQTWPPHACTPQTELVSIPCGPWCSSSHYCWTLGLCLHGLLHKILLRVAPTYFLVFRNSVMRGILWLLVYEWGQRLTTNRKIRRPFPAELPTSLSALLWVLGTVCARPRLSCQVTWMFWMLKVKNEPTTG